MYLQLLSSTGEDTPFRMDDRLIGFLRFESSRFEIGVDWSRNCGAMDEPTTTTTIMASILCAPRARTVRAI